MSRMPHYPAEVRRRLIACLTPLALHYRDRPLPLDFANLIASYLHAAGLRLEIDLPDDRRTREPWSEQERRIRLRLEEAIRAHRQHLGADLDDDDLRGMWA